MKKRQQRILILILPVLIILGIGVWWLMHKDDAIRDSMTMVFHTESAEIEYGAAVDASDLIQSYEGELKTTPVIDTKTLGEQKITYVLTKEGIDKEVSYTIEVKDRQAPVIMVKTEELTLARNDAFQVEDVLASVSDPVDGALKKGQTLKPGTYTIESSVKTEQEGTYEVKIQAMDLNENKSEKVVQVIVSAAPVAKTPDQITKPTYVKGILLVNKNHPVPKNYGALDQTAYAALTDLQVAAGLAGFDMPTISGYRSYEYQAQLYQSYVDRDGQAAADTYSARPGYSEHQTGLAFDVGELDFSYGETAAGRWLNDHAHEYGFILRYQKGKEDITGYTYEPWHIRYVGAEVATEIYKKGITLEEYLNVY